MVISKKEILTANDIIELINQIEVDLKPQDWKVEGIDIWPILKISLYYELSMKILSNRKVTNNRFHLIKRVLKAVYVSFKNKYNTKSSVLFVSDGISYISFFDKLYDRFCDPLIEILNDSNVTWEKWDIAKDLTREKQFRSKNINAPLDLLIFKSIFFNFKYNASKHKNFAFILSDYINIKTSSSFFTAKTIQKKINSICLMVNWYKKQLIASKTKIVLLVCFYSERGMALIKACKDLGIKTADIQHGVQGELHAAYGNWLNSPINGYNTMPDTFLVWSENEAKLNKNSVIIGNVFESKWFKSNDLTNSYDEIVKSISKKLKAKKNILFTVQYGIDYNYKQIELIKATQYEFNWLIRLHPVMSIDEKNTFIQLLIHNGIVNYEIDLSTSLPLYAILRNTSLHVTHSSSTLIEALNFNVPTLLIDKLGQEYFSQNIGSMVVYDNLLENQLTLLRKYLLLTVKDFSIIQNNKFNENFKDFIKLNL